MKQKFIPLLLILAFLTPLISCRNNHYRVSTSSIDADLEVKRLEKDLFSIDPDELIPAVPAIREKYRSFLQLFSYVINTGSIDDPEFGDFLLRFCTDKQNNEVYEYTMKVFSDISGIEKDLEEAFRHYLHYFPGYTLPRVFTCITGFNNSIITVTGDTVLGISLDRYLGADCEYYPQLGIYGYISARMTPDYIISDCMFGWALSKWEFESDGYAASNVLTQIIHNGKLKYFTKCMLPEEMDEILFGFTPEQMKFCRNNEKQMWQYLIEHDLLFSTDQFLIRKLTDEAPFTSYFTNESPGRAAVWLGFRIIESYMMKNPGTSLEDLMNESDVQIILEKAKYSPE